MYKFELQSLIPCLMENTHANSELQPLNINPREEDAHAFLREVLWASPGSKKCAFC